MGHNHAVFAWDCVNGDWTEVVVRLGITVGEAGAID